MKLNKSRTVSIIISITTLIIFAFYFIENQEKFRLLLDVAPLYIVLAAVCHGIVIALNGVFLQQMLREFDKRLSLREGYFVSLISSIGNFFLPLQSGAGIRAVYLKQKYRLAYDNFVSTFTGTYVIVFLVNSLLGFLSILALSDQTDKANAIVVGGVFLSIFIFNLLVIYTRVADRTINAIATIMPSQKLRSAGKNVQKGWRRIVAKKWLVKNLTLIVLVSFVINLILFQIELTSLGLHASFWASVLYASLGSIILILNVTPADLGVREAILIFASSALGLSLSDILALSLLDRIIKFLVLGLSWLLMYRSSDFIFNREASEALD